MQSLAKALSSRDIESFRRALHSSTEVEKNDNQTAMTIFEKACQTPGCAAFIEECILAGCDVNKVSLFFRLLLIYFHQSINQSYFFQLNVELNRRPINFVVESHCEENLAALLRDPSVDLNSKCNMLRTPVNSLAEHITDENFREIFPCIKLLIQHGADVNLPDKREMTPITKILKNGRLSIANKETIVRYLLQNVVEVDIDTHRNGEARVLLQKLLPDIELTPNVLNHVTNHRQWDFNRLFLALKNDREDEFLLGLNNIAEKCPETLHELFTAAESRETLLIVAIGKDLMMAVQKMIDLGADVNYFISSTRDSLPPIKCAVIRGHWRCLEILLKSPDLDINSSPLLPTVVRNLGQIASKGIDFEKCFHILLNHRNIDINQIDVTNCTALHYAVKFNNSSAVLELLKRGAYIGVQNKFNQLSISNINAKVLEKHFDSCITTNGFRLSDDNFEIEFDYRNFIPHQNTAAESVVNEMTSIEYISESTELKRLIMHPLIASFLTLKWNRLALFFYINFFLCVLFAVITVTYILVYYSSGESSTVADFMRIIIFLLTVYIAAREMAQFVFSPRVYLKSLENYLECSLVVLVMLILFNVYSDTWRRIFAATTILLIAIEIFLLAGSLPFWSFSCHYVMLKTVTWSFLKSLSLYAIILLAFSLSFFTLLHEPPKESKESKNSEKDQQNNNDDDDEFNKFNNLGLSIMKTLVMSTGEFDVASINFKLNAFSYLVFIIYLFIVSIVLLNLLNGLAVSDTQAIKSEAELTNFIRRCQVLARYDGVMTNKLV